MFGRELGENLVGKVFEPRRRSELVQQDGDLAVFNVVDHQRDQGAQRVGEVAVFVDVAGERDVEGQGSVDVCEAAGGVQGDVDDVEMVVGDELAQRRGLWRVGIGEPVAVEQVVGELPPR